jgi:hypothetical protein
MGSQAAGTVLTCGHEGCGCRVLIESECNCAGAEQAYRCSCGADMVPVADGP